MGRWLWFLLIFLGTACPVGVWATQPGDGVAWTPYPLVRKEVKGRDQVRLLPMSWPVAQWSVFPSTVGRDAVATQILKPVTQDGVVIRVDNGVGHYHWLQAQHLENDRELTLATVHYFSLPGPSPTAMLLVPKSRLEIIPQPLPREFSIYRSGEEWSFLLRFDQRILPEYLVTLYAPGQMKQTFLSDSNGVVRVVMPPYPEKQAVEAKPGVPARRRGQPFQLAVEWNEKAKQFTTVFQHEYGPAPLASRQPVWGWLVVGLGMAAGFALWRAGRQEAT